MGWSSSVLFYLESEKGGEESQKRVSTLTSKCERWSDQREETEQAR